MTTPKHPLIGPTFKLCLTCGKRIERNGMANFQWIRRKHCSRVCQIAATTKTRWEIRHQ